MPNHPKHGPVVFEYSQITPMIFIGTNQCCVMHFDTGLLKKGISADISLEATKLDAPFGVEYYLWLPTRNHYPPSMNKLKLGVAVLHHLEKMKVKTFVHCERGHGRAPTLVAAYLMHKGMSLKEALALIKKKRPAMHLTQRQVKALKDFERGRRFK